MELYVNLSAVKELVKEIREGDSGLQEEKRAAILQDHLEHMRQLKKDLLVLKQRLEDNKLTELLATRAAEVGYQESLTDSVEDEPAAPSLEDLRRIERKY